MANVTMSAEQAVREHTQLVRVLRHGDKRDLEAEADAQAKELKEYTRKVKRKAKRYNRLDESSRGKGR